MPPKICLSEDFLDFCIHELMNKNLNLQNNLGFMFAQKYPKLKISYKALKSRYDEYINKKKKESTNMRKKIPVIYNNLQEHIKGNYGQKSIRFVKKIIKVYFKQIRGRFLKYKK
jgi:hypothetical protein